ncbi:MAG: hypothetical protein ACLFV8_11305 [Alphaproteobacteria bacterium]
MIPTRKLFRWSPVLAAALLAAAPAAADAAKKKNGIDYTEPFIDDRAAKCNLFPEEDCTPDSGVEGMMARGEYREALKLTRSKLAEERRADKRAGLLALSARLEARLGNRDRAIRDADKALQGGALNDAEKADNYLLLSRLYLAKEPPDFETATEYQRKYNEVTD